MRSKLAFSLLVLLVLAATARAQDGGNRVGIGVSLIQGALIADLEELQFGATFLSNIYVPIIVGRSFKLEPEIGFLRFSEDGEFAEETITQWRFGIGAFYYMRAAESLRAYVGPRLGLQLTSMTDENGGKYEFDETDLLIGIALGGEYFFSDNFSLGGEIQLNYTSFGEPSYKIDGVEQEMDLGRSLINNNGLILLRWYF